MDIVNDKKTLFCNKTDPYDYLLEVGGDIILQSQTSKNLWVIDIIFSGLTPYLTSFVNPPQSTMTLNGLKRFHDG